MAEQRRISLVLSDVDGTLVTKDKVLTKPAQAAVQCLLEAGIRFAITSSRPPGRSSARIGALSRPPDIEALGWAGECCGERRIGDHSETSQRQTQPATKPRGGTEKTEFRVDVLGRGHGNSPPAWPRSPALMGVHEMRRRSRLFPLRALHNFDLH